MSVILRNTLRLVGTAKYAPNNSAKYLRSMTLTTNHLNNSLLSFNQANQISTNFEKIIRTTGNEILSLFAANEEIKKAKIVHLKVSLSSGKVRLITPEREKNLIFPPTFNIELNKGSIEPKSNKIADEEETLSFKLSKWKVLLDDGELKLKVIDTGETFILKHAVHIKAHINPPKPLEDGAFDLTSEPPISNVRSYTAKIISESEGSKPLDREFPPVKTMATAELFKSYGNQVSETLIETGNVEIIEDRPNSFGRMKLKFPMTASLVGAPQEIKITNTDDTYTAYHTVEIRASKKLAENLKNGSADENKKRLSKIGKLRVELVSGDLIFEPRVSSDQSVFIRQEVDIEIDLDSEVPSILINPHIKSYHNF
ncbi:hypothetical protein HCN44_002065 [Aphidius gifuensis]|uniref:Uncharacterized protein n=1 Tax=Aphidius gifuensis TaxID=684658 RepID=A0A834XZH5_APHGI|nr:uncharacterized protein LOC122847416 [Aphidius gifuensis]KAF7996433.1 hypothetical protein HCN44_002065 [Aphidius gifuensis]